MCSDSDTKRPEEQKEGQNEATKKYIHFVVELTAAIGQIAIVMVMFCRCSYGHLLQHTPSIGETMHTYSDPLSLSLANILSFASTSSQSLFADVGVVGQSFAPHTVLWFMLCTLSKLLHFIIGLHYDV